MKTAVYQTAINIIILLLLVNCGKDTPDPQPPNPPNPPVVMAPAAVNLLSPSNNSACLKGNQESGAAATVTFFWEKAANAETYTLEVKNLVTGQTKQFTTDKTSYSEGLKVGMPYSWKVISINSAGKGNSPAWKFYLSGEAESNYVPFPAELVSPASGEVLEANGAATLQVTFTWTCSDVDNDIISYTFYLDNKDASTQIVASQPGNTVKQTLQKGKTYYWKVVAVDKADNRSISVTSSFQIQ